MCQVSWRRHAGAGEARDTIYEYTLSFLLVQYLVVLVIVLFLVVDILLSSLDVS
jgi:hypothetical protein